MAANSTLWTQIQTLEYRRKALDDAKARAASSYATFLTNGTGTSAPATPFDFGTTFLHEPAVTSGAVITRQPGAGWQLPRASCGVLRWVRDARGLYTGAYIYFAVDCPPTDAASPPTDAANPAVTHHLVFQAVGFQDLSSTADDTVNEIIFTINGGTHPVIEPQ